MRGTMAFMFPRIVIDDCVIAVSDWERSNAFYRDVLGAEVDQKDDRFGRYRFGEWQLNIHGPGFTGLNAESRSTAVPYSEGEEGWENDV
jgi:catechol 2,3-dioxygenase-like lactoylglutathione lyase family enzyme